MSDIPNQTIPMYPLTGGGFSSNQGALPPGGTLQTFALLNDESTTSVGFMRVGLCFPQGASPEGTSLEIRRDGAVVPSQFDAISRWPDGSIRFAACCIRDTDFAGDQSRIYDVLGLATPFDNNTTKTINDIIAATDFNVECTNVLNSTGGVHNGGTLTASFNTHAAVATRVTRIASGPICDSYKVWGMFTGAAEDENLKVNWYVTAWKDASGDFVDYEYGAVMAQDWWVSPNKDRLDYDCVLKEGVVTVETFLGVEHVYHSQWLTIDSDPRNTRYCRRRWVTSPPTLHYLPDREYMIASGLIPPLDLSLTEAAQGITANTSSYTTGWYPDPYVPCETMNHRGSIDNTGGYMGRGVLPNCDSAAFVSQRPDLAKHSRTNTLAGLHFPSHYKESRLRTRPTESADIANTAMVMDMNPFINPDYVGLPSPAQAYSQDPRTAATAYFGYTPPAGGEGDWKLSDNTSHAVEYSFYGAIIDAEYYLMEAVIGIALNCAIQRPAGTAGSTPYIMWGDNSYRANLTSIPQTKYKSNTGVGSLGNTRQIAWATNNISAAYAIAPDDLYDTAMLRFFVEKNFEYMGLCVQYLPQEMKDLVALAVTEQVPPWCEFFQFLCSPLAKLRTGTNLLDTWIDTQLNMVKHYNDDPYQFLTQAFKATMWEKKRDWNRDTNPVIPRAFFADTQTSTNSTNNTLTVVKWEDNMYLVEGDPFKFIPTQYNGAAAVIPAGCNEGQIYYARNVVEKTFNFSETPTGALFNVTDDITNAGIQSRASVAVTTPAVRSEPYLPPPDDPATQNMASLVQYLELYPDDTELQTMLATKRDWLINVNPGYWYSWAYRNPA